MEFYEASPLFAHRTHTLTLNSISIFISFYPIYIYDTFFGHSVERGAHLPHPYGSSLYHTHIHENDTSAQNCEEKSACVLCRVHFSMVFTVSNRPELRLVYLSMVAHVLMLVAAMVSVGVFFLSNFVSAGFNS